MKDNVKPGWFQDGYLGWDFCESNKLELGSNRLHRHGFFGFIRFGFLGKTTLVKFLHFVIIYNAQSVQPFGILVDNHQRLALVFLHMIS